MDGIFNRLAVTPSPVKSKRSPRRSFLSTGRMRGGDKTQSSADRERAMRDYKLSIEYRHLKSHCPGGVYLVPSLDDLRLFHGVVFVRRGAFTNGVFKFTLKCSPEYNGPGTHPTVTFSSYVYNPHVHQETGEVDLPVAFPKWDPSTHFLVTALTYVKRIFYVKDYSKLKPDEMARLPNQDALRLFQTDREGYVRRVLQCVNESQRTMYVNDPGCTLRFGQDRPELAAMRDMLRERAGVGDGDREGEVTREEALEIVERTAQLREERNGQGDGGEQNDPGRGNENDQTGK